MTNETSEDLVSPKFDGSDLHSCECKICSCGSKFYTGIDDQSHGNDIDSKGND